MEENRMAMVTISVDEYFDLRSKGEQNLYICNTVGGLQKEVDQMRKELWELKQLINKEV